MLPGLDVLHSKAGLAAVEMDSELQSWPDLLGTDTATAQSTIQRDAPGKRIMLVPAGNIVTMDFRSDRVRVFYNPDTNMVTEVPRVG